VQLQYHTTSVTHLTNDMGQTPQLVNKFPAFYRSPSFITLVTTAC